MTEQPFRKDGRDRILRSARELFTRDGIRATTLRGVAAHAGVAPSLIVHHFRSKAGLYAAVDAELLGRLIAAYAREEASLAGRARATRALMRSDPEFVGYLGRVLAEGGDMTTLLLERILEAAREDVARLKESGAVPQDADDEWFILHHVLLLFGPLMLRPSIERVLGQSLFESPGFERWAEANERLLEHGWYRR